MAGKKISEVGDLKTIAAGDLVEIERPGAPAESHRVALGTMAGEDSANYALLSLVNAVAKRTMVRVATTANITISTALNNGDTLDGVTLATGDLVLVKDQSTGSQNGIYVVGASPARDTQFDSWAEHPGVVIAVQEGTVNADTVWLCTSNLGGTLGTTSLAFTRMVFATQDANGVHLSPGVPFWFGENLADVINIGNVAWSSSGDLQYCQIQYSGGGGGWTGGNFASRQFENTPSCSFISFFKSRSATKGTNTVVQVSDDLGEVGYCGYDGTQYTKGAFATAVCKGSPSNGVMPTTYWIGTMNGSGTFTFHAFDYRGSVGIGMAATSHYAQLEVLGASGLEAISGYQGNSNKASASFSASHASYASDLMYLNATRAANSAYAFLRAYSANFGDTEFLLRGDGTGLCDGSWTGSGADYAEYFEWADGNADDEDRRGLTVVLDGEKIRPATQADDPAKIIGAVSVNPTVVGDAAWSRWNGKYLVDDYDQPIMEEYEAWEWDEDVEETVGHGQRQKIQTVTKLHSYAADAIPQDVVVPADKRIAVLTRKKLNPTFDENAPYSPREQRKEWVTIGLMGKLRIRKGQPVGDRWLKMRAISDAVDEWLIR